MPFDPHVQYPTIVLPLVDGTHVEIRLSKHRISEAAYRQLTCLLEQLQPSIVEPDEPPTFKLVLINMGDKKIQIIKETRALTGLGLKEAKDLVEASENGPTLLKAGLLEDEAKKWRAVFHQAGATVAMELD